MPRVRNECFLVGGHFGPALPPQPVYFQTLFTSEAEELGSRELDIGSKKIFIDLRLNDQGKFVRIVEVSSLPSRPLPAYRLRSQFPSSRVVELLFVLYVVHGTR